MISLPRISKLLNCLLPTFIILWLVCLYCSNTNLFLVNVGLFLHRVSIFWLENLYILQKVYKLALKVRVLCVRAKLAFMAGIFLKKYAWYTKIYFQFYFFAIWSIQASILPTIAWKAPASSWSPSELPCFLILGRSVNFKIPKGFLRRRPVFPDHVSVSCDYDGTKTF